MAATSKRCTKCGDTKTVDQFGWSNRAKGKLHAQCKVCRSAYREQRREEKRKAKQALAQVYREDNCVEILVQQRRIREEEKSEAIRAQQQAKRDRQSVARALANARAAAHYATEEGKLLNAARELHRLFYKGELGRVRLPRAEARIGCTCEQYRDYLASNFKAGMTHDNYGLGEGTWQPDHIIPKAAFKGEINDANLEIVYWWGNVQPLWFRENAAKGDYYTEEGKSDLIDNYNAWVAAGRPAP